MRIIPAIDIIDGKCVRLTKGDYTTKKIYNEDPLEVAKEFEGNGLQHLHLVDLDGAKSKRIVNHKILQKISSKTSLKVDFGGGIQSNKELIIAFENGANQITAGNIAVSNSSLFLEWLGEYGADKIILGADFRDRKVATNAWTSFSEEDVIDFISTYHGKGVKYAICTDVGKDGMLQGTSNEMYEEILSATNIKLIASGGISCMNDLDLLEKIGCEGVIIGKAIYEGRITLKELQKRC